jgi:predicted ATPase/DNA-binding SARP family transcriptional activator
MMLPANSSNGRLQIDTLGGLTIQLGKTAGASGAEAAQPLHFDARSAEALLVYLACHARPLARDTLAELLWPERSQAQALANLRSCIHRLRLQLASYLATTRQTVAFAPDASIQVDARELEGHLAAGRLVEAVALYRGDFLDGFYLEGSPAFEQWALLERERLRNLVISAYQQLVTQAAAACQLETAIRHAEQLLHLDPLHEPAHRQLMRLLAQTGRRAAALAQYTACCRVLEVELGVPPDDATTALYEQIRTDHFEFSILDGGLPVTADGADTPKAGVPIGPQNPKLNNLPPQPTPFIGRRAELAQVSELLSNPDCRLLTLLGLGGIGKTRLALESATRLAARFAHGVCFVALAPIATADFVLVTIGQSLGLQNTGGDLQAQVVAYLQARDLLLVLDSFEHLPDAAAVIAHLLHAAPRLKMLVTSRERLYLREEWLLSVAGLGTEQGLAGEAEQLFLHTAQRVRPGFIAHGQAEAIAAICRQVEGMPLALELAASWVRVMSCAEIARQLAVSPELLKTTLRNLPERHRSLRSLFDHSWRLLDSAEQAVLRRLSVFRGGWTLDQAAEVAGATLPLLLSLVDKSLVRTTEQGRFDLHELVRQYAAGQLATSGEVEVIRQRHLVAYLQLARTADRQLRRPEAGRWYPRLDSEQDNLRAALQWALDTARYADVAWLGLAFRHFWYTRGHWIEGVGWLERLLPHRQVLATMLRLATFITLYNFWQLLGKRALIDHYLDEYTQLLGTCPHKLLRAVGWRILAVSTANFLQASLLWEQCIELARAAAYTPGPGDEFCAVNDGGYQLAVTLTRYATRLTDEGELERAAMLSSEALKLLQRQGDREFIAYGLGNLGRLALLRGDVGQARQFLQEAVTMAAADGNRLGLADWQPRLGIVTLYAGDVTEARRLLTESLSLCMGLKGDLVLARVYTYLAELALWEGKLDQAEQWLAQSVVDHAHPRWIRIELVECVWLAARLATAQQQFLRAATLFGLAEQLHRHTRYELLGPVRSLVEAALATVQAALDPAVFAATFSTGEQLSLEEAFATILAPSQEVGNRAASVGCVQ